MAGAGVHRGQRPGFVGTDEPLLAAVLRWPAKRGRRAPSHHAGDRPPTPARVGNHANLVGRSSGSAYHPMSRQAYRTRPSNEGGSAIAASPQGLRLHISLFGRRTWASQACSARSRQQVSIVSEHAGTTDPVRSPWSFPSGARAIHRYGGNRRRGNWTSARRRTRQVFDRAIAPW